MLSAAQSSQQRQEADFLISQGRFPEAQRALDDLIRELGDATAVPLRVELCNALLAHTTVLLVSNRFEDASAALARAKDVAEKLPAVVRRGNLANVHYFRANLYVKPHSPLFDLAEADAELRQLRELQLIDVSWLTDELEVNLAMLRGEWSRAIVLGERVIDTLARSGWRGGVTAMRGRIGGACIDAGELARAESLLSDGLAYAREFGPPDVLARIEMQMARLRSRQARHEEAWQAAERALDGLDSLIRNFRVLSEQQRFLADKLKTYDEAFAVALAGGATPLWVFRAWSVAERAKSFYLCQLIANAGVPLFDGVAPEVLGRVRELEDQLDLLERSRANTLGRGDRERAAMEEKAQQLYAERQALADSIMANNPRWAAVRPSPGLPLEEACRRLQATDASWVPLSFYWQEHAGVGRTPAWPAADLHLFFSLEPGTVEHEVIPWSSDERRRLRVAGDALSGAVRPSAELCPDDLLEKILPASLRARLSGPGRRRLLVSPHLDLHKLPLHALGEAGSSLISHAPVQYIPTLSLLSMARPRARVQEVGLLGCVNNGFGDRPLTDVEAEIEGIRAAWAARRPQAVRARIVPHDGTLAQAGLPLSEWAKFEYLHIACHGVFPEGRPFDASLRLGREAVRAAELFGMKLNCALVALSACALGRRARQDDAGAMRSDEWVGIYLPLFYAGAGALLVSLWDAESDAAAKLMTALHERLAGGESDPADALRHALDSVADRPAPHSANWYLVGVPSGQPS